MGEAPTMQSPLRQTGAGDILPDTDHGPGATAKGSNGTTGLLGAPHWTRKED